MEHKSIFKIVENYHSDPLTEFGKISNFLTSHYPVNSYNCFEVLSHSFLLCSELSSVFSSLDSCFNESINNLKTYSNLGADFEYLEDDKKEQIFDEFLTYSEILLTCYLLTKKYVNTIYKYGKSFNLCFKQSFEMLVKSLKSVGYTYNELENDICEIRKIDPIVEQVAIKSPSNVCEAMLSYLSARDNDISDKENCLESLIKQMMPDLQKYQSEKLVSKAKQYSQLIRHKTEKEYQEKYSWFYSNEENYIDDLFHLIVAAQQYINGTKIAGDFDKNSSKV